MTFTFASSSSSSSHCLQESNGRVHFVCVCVCVRARFTASRREEHSLCCVALRPIVITRDALVCSSSAVARDLEQYHHPSRIPDESAFSFPSTPLHSTLLFIVSFFFSFFFKKINKSILVLKNKERNWIDGCRHGRSSSLAVYYNEDRRPRE